MKVLAAAIVIGLSSTSAGSQPRDSVHQTPHPDAGYEVCKPDIQKFCSAANLPKECLVAHWNRISSDCQDVLALPARHGGDGGK
jgi:hypothetical protein